jgi:hypothetical protein
MSRLVILGARMVTRRKFPAENPQILGATVQNIFATATRRQGFVQPCPKIIMWTINEVSVFNRYTLSKQLAFHS